MRAKKVRHNPETGLLEDVKITVFDKHLGKEVEVVVNKEFSNEVWDLMKETARNSKKPFHEVSGGWVPLIGKSYKLK